MVYRRFGSVCVDGIEGLLKFGFVPDFDVEGLCFGEFGAGFFACDEEVGGFGDRAGDFCAEGFEAFGEVGSVEVF